MKCLGCYKKIEKNEYCLSCRKKLFDGKRVPTVLDFDKPKAENMKMYNEHSKRMSISGVQLKYSLRLNGNKLELCETNGQYIIKPIPTADHLEMMEDAPENEHLTMQIASQIFNIKTAHNALIYFKDGTPAYITKRFDVKGDGTKYVQEDFAQITNRTKETHGESYKYDGSYLEIGKLIKKYVPASMIAIENFFKIIVFNYIFSNGDAHLKNFSLIRNDFGEMELSPTYDLMSTIIHTPNESDTALELFDKDSDLAYYATYGHYGRIEFIEFAKLLGIVEVRYMRIINEFIENETEVNVFIQNSSLSNKALDSLISNLKSRIKRFSEIQI
jgi:serine/threonine-protein kinase HipA